MATHSLQLLPLILSVLCISCSVASATPTNFLQASCRSTRFPEVCLGSLTSHANDIGESPHVLARTALTESLAMAESTKGNMLKLANLRGLKPVEYGALKDCLDQIQDSVDGLSQSLRELGELSRCHDEDFLWHKSNVVTWTSAALNQIGTCSEGFSSQDLDGKIKDSVQGQVTNVEQLITNSLSLFKQIAANH